MKFVQGLVAFVLISFALVVYAAPEVSGEKPESPRSLAEAYMSEGKYSEVRDELNKALKEKDLSDADKADIQLQIALSYYEAGDYERAKPELEKVLIMPGADETQRRNQGWANYVPTREAKLRLLKMNPSSEEEKTLSVFFIGSSMTLRGYMPLLVERMSASAPAGRPRLMTAMHTRGGTRLNTFWDEGDARNTARGKMASMPWDFVVVEMYRAMKLEDALKYGKLYADFARSRNIKPIFYETHTEKASPHPQSAREFHARNVEVGKTVNAPIAPVALAEIYYLEAVPTAEHSMFYADWIHPSPMGYHLVAYCIYSAITGYSPVGLYHDGSISDEDAKALQEAAWKAVQETNPNLEPIE